MDLNQAFGEVATSNQTLGFVVLILANFILGVLAALKDGKFEWKELAGIFNKVLPMFGSYLALATVGQGVEGPAGDAVENGALLAGLPFLLGAWKNLKATGIPQIIASTLAHTVKEVTDTKPPTPPASGRP